MYNPLRAIRQFFRRRYQITKATVQEHIKFRNLTKSQTKPNGHRARVYKNKAGEMFSVSREEQPHLKKVNTIHYAIAIEKINGSAHTPTSAEVEVESTPRTIRLNSLGKFNGEYIDTELAPKGGEKGRGHFTAILDEMKQLGQKHFDGHNYTITMDVPTNLKVLSYLKSFGLTETKLGKTNKPSLIQKIN
ncbi:MAG: hypothetical protein WCW13_00940 [archaeon]|jgi:hypothetical protein